MGSEKLQMIKKEIPVRSYTGEKWKTNKTNKKYLALDFKNRCAYCDDYDKIYGGKDSYHVEHFAPKEKFPKLEFTYDNLLYACSYCNTSKSDDWVSNDPTINVVGDCGYIDPCSNEYYNHLDRNNETGEIYYKTDLGKYMYNHLKLYLKRHSIIFMMNKLQEKICKLSISIENDKKLGINTFQKEQFLSDYQKMFYDYYCQIQKE